MKIIKNMNKIQFSTIKGDSFGRKWKSVQNWVAKNLSGKEMNNLLPSVENLVQYLKHNRIARNHLK